MSDILNKVKSIVTGIRNLFANAITLGTIVAVTNTEPITIHQP